MTAIDAAVEANARYAETTEPVGGTAPPTRRLAVLTCMDARVDPLRALGLGPGEAHVIRNAGGRATPDALRSLTLSGQLLGTREIMVVHHTDCGLHAPSEATLRAQLDAAVGEDTSAMELASFDDEEGGVVADVATIRGWRFLPPDAVVRGFLLDVVTNRLREIPTA